jgi:hypothetical protein
MIATLAVSPSPHSPHLGAHDDGEVGGSSEAPAHGCSGHQHLHRAALKQQARHILLRLRLGLMQECNAVAASRVGQGGDEGRGKRVSAEICEVMRGGSASD